MLLARPNRRYPAAICAFTLLAVSACAGGSSVPAGSSHALGARVAALPATTPSPAIFGWGDNRSGQIGDGKNVSTDVPVKATPVPGVTAIAGGGAHNLAIGTGGTVWAWGWNHYGELGDGTTTGPQLCGKDGCSLSPIQVPGLTGAVAVAAGDIHSVALLSDGSVWAWGNNQYGELGNGTQTTSGCLCIDTPVQSSVPTGIIALSGGGRYTLALRNDGTVWAWGMNSDGQLGDGTLANSSLPVQVKNLSGITAISAGYFHALALSSTGSVYAWGKNLDGQLGDNSTVNSDVPVQVTGLTQITAISGGGEFSMALRSDGTVWTWGDNAYGELGTGSSASKVLLPAQVGGIAGVTRIAAGHKHALALESSGAIWAWGDNQYGELGNATTTSSKVPVLTSGKLAKITALGAGDQFSIALRP